MDQALSPGVLQLIDLALDEDAGRGDVTTRLTVPKDAVGAGRVVAKSEVVISGLAVFAATMRRVDARIAVTPRVADGAANPRPATTCGAMHSRAGRASSINCLAPSDCALRRSAAIRL